MPDNVTIDTGSGATVLADEVTDGTLGTGVAQYVKLMDATPDSTNKAVVGSDGSLQVSGPVTDAELRATPVPVALDDASLAVLESIDATINDGGGSITIDGSVSVSNLPATQTVDGTVELGATTLAALESIAVTDGGGSITVDGPLTDTQLRATAVPVSGTVALDSGTITSLTTGGALTDTQLRATAVPVASNDAAASGSFTASGQTVQVAVNGYSAVGFSLSGTFSGLTVNVERSSDGGTTWSRSSFLLAAQNNTFNWVNAATSQNSVAAGRQLLVDTAGATGVRLNAVTFVSGTASVGVALTNAPISPMLALLNNNGLLSSDVYAGGIAMSGGQPNADGTSVSFNRLNVSAAQQLFNESTWDRQRGNTDVQLLSSSARTATNNSADQTSYNNRRLLLLVDVSVAGTGSITPSLQVKEKNSNNYKTIWTAATALTATGTYAYYFADGALSTSGTFTEVLPFGLPSRVWRLAMTHNNANTISYSASAVSGV